MRYTVNRIPQNFALLVFYFGHACNDASGLHIVTRGDKNYMPCGNRTKRIIFISYSSPKTAPSVQCQLPQKVIKNAKTMR